jgi:hypothetical protein
MLSIEKAYTVSNWNASWPVCKKKPTPVGIESVTFRLTPKLDGLAGRDDGRVFATRGNGEVGYEISSAFTKGVVPIGGRGQGVGEIVVVKSYFDEHMADFFEHPRNMVVGIISSDTLSENAKTALNDRHGPFRPLQPGQRNRVTATCWWKTSRPGPGSAGRCGLPHRRCGGRSHRRAVEGTHGRHGSPLPLADRHKDQG